MARHTRLLLIRHGQTTANVLGRWDGATDTPLTPYGHEQAQRLAHWLGLHMPPDALYTSPLQRAQHTATPLAQQLGLDLSIDPELVEINFGECEGWSTADIFTRFPHLARPWQERHAPDRPDWCWPGGEYERQYYQRARDTTLRLANAHPGQTIAAISHGGFIVSVITWLTHGVLAFAEELTVDNTSITEIDYDGRNMRLMQTNLTPHLSEIRS